MDQNELIQLRLIYGRIQYRQRGFVVDASGAFCGLTEFGEWQDIPAVKGDETDARFA